MESVFIGRLEPFLDAVASEMDLYVPKKAGDHCAYGKYDPSAGICGEFNDIRVCTPAKEFLFPLRELAAVFPEPVEADQIKPFAVFGLKDCDLRSIEILDKVFIEEEFQDPLYVKRRENMFIISSDCCGAGESCFCGLFNGQPFVSGGFDVNVSKVRDGFIVEADSDKGKDFLAKNSELFTDVPEAVLAERNENRTEIQKQLEQKTADLGLDGPIKEIVENSQDCDVFDTEAKNCIECQACTRICPTCHCFYLYDTKQKDYFAKMKMWDSCMRTAYAEVAGGANPHEILGDRIKHRLMHKFAYFLDRYGIDMCVGCGRCVDADAGGMDLRVVLKKLSDELKGRDKKEAEVGI